MNLPDIILSDHAAMQMQRRRVTLEDLALVLRVGDHVDGREEGTREVCIELDGRPLTVVYDSERERSTGMIHVITVLRRTCS